MEKVIKLENIPVKLDRKTVLEQIGCYEDSPVYEETAEIYEELKEKAGSMCRPVALFKFAGLDESLASGKFQTDLPVVYTLYSIGGEISAYSTKAFENGDYLSGMIIDAMADCMLFSMEEGVLDGLKEMCAARQLGVAGRLEAPVDLPMEAQLVIHRETEALRLCKIGISSGYMFDPVKSNGMVFVLTEDASVFQSQHDCRKCSRRDCKWRKVPKVEVEVRRGEELYPILLEEGESITDGLKRAGVYVSAVCGGRGSCGKCKIRVMEGELPVTEWDRKAFTKEELQEGWRLSCRAFPRDRVSIRMDLRDEVEFEILDSFGEGAEHAGSSGRKAGQQEVRGWEYGIAVDIGTTTLAMQLMDMESGRAVQTYTAINRQRAYGADVISRIKASCEGAKAALKESIREDLNRGIRWLMEKTGMTQEQVRGIVIAGNTTMIHLLMGYDCAGLGVYPFTPVNIDLIRGGSREILGGDLDVPVSVLPGISAYVGGDITAGLLECGFDRSEEISMLIDLGTNGEMAIGNRERILVTSTAAGPAFEGGNIQWGTGSVAGAISSVEIKNGKVRIHTIGEREPVGICGTGVLETAAELVHNGIADETGLLDEKYFDGGYPLAVGKDGKTICFTQQDVREIQLAKAAVRAGLETLILRYGIHKEEISHIYLAGGFGFHLDMQKAIRIGLLPEEFEGRVRTVGNSSLGGAVRFLMEKGAEDRLERMRGVTSEIGLSNDRDFHAFYMDYMFFGQDV